ncbi:MAG: YccF domain-containing protein [Cyclobacteriaceae bacterium]|nr:YccF domain-containing protein [Cyclobacteriaceae bacterium]MCK5470004.1 YccF domain-containing protein [Cyclobacteriaceae bacterium]
MNILGNLIWIIFGGFIIFLLYLFGSFLLFITIVGIPFGIQTLKLAILSLAPFGKDVIPGERSGGCLYIVMNIIWILIAGIEIAIIHAILAFLFAITIIGIPFAAQHIKLAYLALVPFGNDIVEKQ